ncbi:alpha/beta hydrolase [Polluticaenibacter yanchengensis]|uniref:Alpha/beta hydrolase n=1 Tax=Polluticaenibacter yanchengensis TaxID=3014562 RepID=A0ABT4UIT5_9BACT|nr:alpha/beta hydrolase [Chitinophagaceae bacterium LY-5]
MDKVLYVISGLGADYRVFKNLDLNDWTLIHLKWMKPEKDEKIEDYAQRMAAFITHPDPIILGLSFGGMMAIEISKIITTRHVILVSSVKTFKELPPFIAAAGKLGLHKFAVKPFFKPGAPMLYQVMGVSLPEDKKLLDDIIADADMAFYNWAIDKIVYWKNEVVPGNLTHIHGKNDKLMGSKYIHDFNGVDEGGHLMVLNKPKEVGEIILSTLKALC